MNDQNTEYKDYLSQLPSDFRKAFQTHKSLDGGFFNIEELDGMLNHQNFKQFNGWDIPQNPLRFLEAIQFLFNAKVIHLDNATEDIQETLREILEVEESWDDSTDALDNASSNKWQELFKQLPKNVQQVDNPRSDLHFTNIRIEDAYLYCCELSEWDGSEFSELDRSTENIDNDNMEMAGARHFIKAILYMQRAGLLMWTEELEKIQAIVASQNLNYKQRYCVGS